MFVEATESERLRAFNRFYTQTIGVLTDRYLGQARPLGEARLLFEIGVDGADIRDLRGRLDLDSGYLSRVLGSLRDQGLLDIRSSASDGRVRVATLTAAGRRELAELDNRSTEVAEVLLEPLTDRQRSELIAALDTVTRRLRLATVLFDEVDPASNAARWCLDQYAAEIDRRFPEGYDRSALVTPDRMREAGGVFLVARERDRTVGCGLLREQAPGLGELKHLWVHASARRLGLGRRLLTELERRAVGRGILTLRLDTHEVLTEALAMYRACGYREVERYDDNPYAHHWFEKSLSTSSCPEAPTPGSAPTA